MTASVGRSARWMDVYDGILVARMRCLVIVDVRMASRDGFSVSSTTLALVIALRGG